LRPKKSINKIKEARWKPLLTKGLIEERELEIKFLKMNCSTFSKRGLDLVVIWYCKIIFSKTNPRSSFHRSSGYSRSKKYDFIFDKSSDLTMLFAAKDLT
jgi:hypothetical protein